MQKSQKAKKLEELKRKAQEKKKIMKIQPRQVPELLPNQPDDIQAPLNSQQKANENEEAKEGEAQHPKQTSEMIKEKPIDEEHNFEIIPEKPMEVHEHHLDDLNEKRGEVALQDQGLQLPSRPNNSQDVEVPSKIQKKTQKIVLKELAYVKLAIRNLQGAMKGLEYLQSKVQEEPRLRDRIRKSLQELKELNLL